MATKAVGQITVFDYSDGYSVMLTNPSYTFIGDEDSVRGVQSVTTRVVAMQGASQINASVDTSQIIKPTGFTVTSNGATPSPTLTIQANQSVTDAGVLTIPVTVATGVTVSLQWPYSIAFTGGKGDTGDAGRGVTGTTVQYAPGTLPTTPPSSGWDDTVPSVDEGKYLWVKTVFTYSSGDPVTTYSVAKQGEKGSTGNGISSTVVEYAESTSGVTPPATIASWGSDIPNVAQGNYLWTRTTTNYTGSNPTVSYSVARIGMDGEPATTYSLIVSHAAIAKSASGTFSPTSITLTAKSQTGTGAFANYSGRLKIEVHNGSSWSTKYTSSSNENTKSYTIPSGITQVRCSLYLAGGTTTLLDQQTVPVVSDGTSVTITSKSVKYQKGTSGTTAPTGTWSDSIPSNIGENEYLWTQTIVNYSDGNSTEAYSVSRNAANGFSPTVSSTTVEYVESTSGTAHPTSGWSTTPPTTMTAGRYMWTKTTVTYDDGNTSESYAVSRNGSNGGDAYTVILDNESHTFAGGTSAAIAGTATVNVYAYKGTTAIAPTVTKSSITGLPTGMTVKTVTNDSTNKKSTIVFQVTTSMVTRSGLVTIPVVADGKTFSKTFSYALALKGDTGVSISSVTNYYLATSASSGVTTSTSGWTTTVQTMDATKQYLWNYEVVSGSDGSTLNTTTPVIIGRYGQNGGKGDTGRGITSITEHYQVSSSNSTAPTTWSDTMVNTTATNKYLWNYETITYTDGTTEDSTKRVIGTHGEKGDTGASIASVTNYYLASASSSGVTTSTSGWTTNPTASAATMTSTKQYLWNYEVIKDSNNTTITTTNPVIIGRYGRNGGTGPDGRGITGITEYYLATSASSGVTTSTSGWTTAVQTTDATNKYLWNYEVISYTSGNPDTSDPRIIGTYGDKGDKGDTGKALTGITEYYALNNSTTAPADSSFSTTVKTPTASNKYVWNYEQLSWNDNGTTSTTKTTKHIVAVYGDKGNKGDKGDTGNTGKSLTGITEYYAVNNSTTAPADSSFSTTVAAPTSSNKYLWNYELLTWDDNGTASTTKTDKHIAAVYGDKGNKGDKGDKGDRGATWYAGTGITGTSTTATIFSGSGVASAIVGDHYLNTSTQNVYRCTVAGAASTAKWVYEQNIKGARGTQGAKGDTGDTCYFHIKYSNDGGATFTGNSGEDAGSYIGTYSDNTEADSTSVSSYKWVKIEGDDGTSVTVSSIKYAVSTTESQPADSAFTYNSVPTVAEGSWLWTLTTYSNGSKAYTKAKQGQKGNAGTSVTVSSIKYAVTTTESQPADSAFTYNSVPTVAEGSWLWTLTTFSNGSKIYSKAKQGKAGTNGTTFTPSVDASGNISWTNDGGKTNPTAVNIKGPQGDKGDKGVGVTSITKTGTSGTVDTYTIKYTDNTSTTFTVTNGTNGTNGTSAEWFYGTALTHTSGTATATISGAKVGDMYLNTATSNVYKCTAKNVWTYAGNIADGVLDNIEVGGRNLYAFKDTNFPYTSWGVTLTPESDGWIHVVGTPNNTNSAIINPWGNLPSSRFGAGTYTLSVENNNLLTDEFRVQLYHYDTVNSTGSHANYFADTGAITVDVKGFVLRVCLFVSASFSGTSVDGRFRFKLERGNIATDWTPAPEDVDASIATAQSTADRKKQTFITTPTTPYYVGDIYFVDGKLLVCRTERLTGSYTADDWSEDLGYASSDTVATLEASTKTELDTIRSEASANYTSLSDSLDKIQASFNTQVEQTSEDFSIRINGLLESLTSLANDTSTKFAEYSKYFRFTADGLEIGEESNALTLVLDNDKISFRRNRVEFSYWDGSDNSFHVGDIIVDVNQVARFGSFGLVPLEGGDLAWKWLGGST